MLALTFTNLFLSLWVCSVFCDQNAESNPSMYLSGSRQTNNKVSESLVKFYFTNDLNHSINPCDDFFKHVCGEPLVSDEKMEEIREDLERKMATRLAASVKSAMKKQTSKWFETFLFTYQKCMKREVGVPRKDLLPLVEKVGGWKMLGSKTEANHSMESLAGVVFYHTGIPTILGEPRLHTALYAYIEIKFKDDRKKYGSQDRKLAVRKFYTKYVAPAQKWSVDDINFAVNGFVAMDDSIQGSFDMDLSNSSLNASLISFTEPVPFVSSAFYNEGSRRDNLEIYHTRISEKNFAYLHYVLQNYSMGELRNYVFTKMFLEVTKAEHSDLECADFLRNRLQIANARLIVEQFMGPKARLDMATMISYIANAYRESIKSNFGSKPKLFQYLMNKINIIRSRIGWPEWLLHDKALNDWYRGLHLRRSRVLSFSQTKLELWRFQREKTVSLMNERFTLDGLFDMDPLTANALFKSWRHLVNFYAGFLLPPFYHSDAPAVANFGAIGSFIAHEFGHAFDSNLVPIRYNGKSLHSQVQTVPEEIEEYFEKRKSSPCVKAHYGKYCLAENLCVNGTRTLSENLADILGINMAFNGYKKWVRGQGTRFDKSVSSHSLSDEKVFFLSFGKMWCNYLDEKGAKKYINEYVHSPMSVRLNAAVSQMKDFQNTFQCPKGSQMTTPTDKVCPIW